MNADYVHTESVSALASTTSATKLTSIYASGRRWRSRAHIVPNTRWLDFPEDDCFEGSFERSFLVSFSDAVDRLEFTVDPAYVTLGWSAPIWRSVGKTSSSSLKSLD